MENSIKIIIVLILVFIVYRRLCNKIEGMADTTNITEQINKIYKADVQSIRNLSTIADKLQKGGLTVAGNLTVDGNITSKGKFNYLPRGSIIAFNGTNAPQGWALCNGQNGTPDLRGKFIYGHGAGQGSSVGRTGGSETHTLNVNEMPSHNHGCSIGNTSETRKVKSHPGTRWDEPGHSTNGHGFWGKRFNHNHSCSISSNGGNQPHNNMPPYYVLSYIMKL